MLQVESKTAEEAVEADDTELDNVDICDCKEMTEFCKLLTEFCKLLI